MRLTSIVMVHFIPTGLWWFCYINKHSLLAFNVVSTLNTFFNSVSIITNCTYAIMRESNITTCVNNLFTLFKLAYYI